MGCTVFTLLSVAAAAAAVATARSASESSAAAPTVALSFDEASGGAYTVSVEGQDWYSSPIGSTSLCVEGKQVQLTLASTTKASGTDAKFGKWTGTTASYGDVEYTFKAFQDHANVAVGTVSFPNDLNTTGCGSNSDLTTHFPEWSTTAARGADLHTLSWRGDVRQANLAVHFILSYCSSS